MSKIEDYRNRLRNLQSWDSFLLAESNLPGPRANLELAYAFAAEADEAKCLRYSALDVRKAPGNTKREFLAFCGVLGLSSLLARGHKEHVPKIQEHASDPRWRIREAVVHGLQHYGRSNMGGLLEEMESWSTESLLERRAAVAALCEPSLLRDQKDAQRVLDILDAVTSSVLGEEDRKSDQFKTLRKTLGYCWSVVAVVLTEATLERMGNWIATQDKDVLWIMKQNLKKQRLIRLVPHWVQAQLEGLGRQKQMPREGRH